MTRTIWLLLLATGCDGLGGPTEDTGTDLVPVTVWVTHPGDTCLTIETLQLPAKYWANYADGATADCNDMSWYAFTDEGDCWEFSGICGETLFMDPFITRNAGDPPITEAECANDLCP